MFNNHQRVLLQQQFFKTPDQLQDIFKMKTGCRFIKNEEGVFNIRPGNETCKLQPLGLTTRQRARRLAEPYVSKADLVKNRKFSGNVFLSTEKSIASRTVRSRTSAIDSPRYFASRFQACNEAPAILADCLNIGQKLHFNAHTPLARTGLAAAARNVERKIPRFPSAVFCVRRSGK